MTQAKVEFAVHRVKLLVDSGSLRVGFDDTMLGAKRLLSRFDGGKRTSRQSCENGGTQAGHFGLWNKDWFVQNVGVYTVEHFVFLGNAAGVYHAMNGNAILFHSFEDHPSVERSALDRGKKLILCGVREIPTERDAAEIGIYEHGAVSVVPSKTKQPRLARAEGTETSRKVGDRLLRPTSNRFENVTRGGKARFDSGFCGMNRTGDYAANAGD